LVVLLLVDGHEWCLVVLLLVDGRERCLMVLLLLLMNLLFSLLKQVVFINIKLKLAAVT
jgi:hypothetical protein